MTKIICANFCRLHIFISFRALYFKVSDYGSRMNVGSVSIPASGFSALIWHGRPRVSGHRWHRGPVWPGQDIGRVQWPQRARRASRDIGAGMGRSRSRALTPDPGHLVPVSPPCPGSVGAGAGTLQSSLRPPSPPRSSSASSWLHLRVSSLVSHFCPQSSDTAGTIRRQSVRATGPHRQWSAPRPGQQQGGWTVIRGVWRLLCVLWDLKQRIKFSFEIQEPLCVQSYSHSPQLVPNISSTAKLWTSFSQGRLWSLWSWAAQTQYPHSKLEFRIYCLLCSVSLCYIEDIGLECFNMTEW